MAFVADRTANGTSVLALFERGRIAPPVLGQREGTTVSARVLAGKVLLLDAKYLDLWGRNRSNVTVPSRHLINEMTPFRVVCGSLGPKISNFPYNLFILKRITALPRLSGPFQNISRISKYNRNQAPNAIHRTAK